MEKKICLFIVLNLGDGWLIINLNAILALGLDDGDVCDIRMTEAPNECDPFVEIFVNDRSVFDTAPLDDVVGWTPIEKTFFSEIISENSTILIKVWDYDPHRIDSNELILQHQMDVATLLKMNSIRGRMSMLTLKTTWINEYKNVNSYQK